MRRWRACAGSPARWRRAVVRPWLCPWWSRGPSAIADRTRRPLYFRTGYSSGASCGGGPFTSAGTRSCWTRRWSTWHARQGQNCRPTMDFRLSRHAEWEMDRRGIPLALVQAVMDHPEQRLVDESGTGRWIPVAVTVRRWENVSIASRGGRRRSAACDYHGLPDQQD